MPKTKERASIGGSRTCDGSDSIPAEDLRAFRDVFTRHQEGPEGGKKEEVRHWGTL